VRSEDEDFALGGSPNAPSVAAIPPPLGQSPLHRKYFLSLLQKRMPEPYTGLDATRLSAVRRCFGISFQFTVICNFERCGFF
jgi:hypothetical protein